MEIQNKFYVKWTYEFKDFPVVIWDKETPLVIHETDQYFFSVDALLCHCISEKIHPSELMLCLCEPNYADEIDTDSLFEEYLPEDMTVRDMFPELAEAIDKVNDLIRENKTPLSWGASKVRVRIPSEILEELPETLKEFDND